MQMERLDHANYVWLHYCYQMPNAEREKNYAIISLLYFLEKVGIKPGPPAQLASALSINPWPLG